MSFISVDVEAGRNGHISYDGWQINKLKYQCKVSFCYLMKIKQQGEQQKWLMVKVNQPAFLMPGPASTSFLLQTSHRQNFFLFLSRMLNDSIF